MGIERQLGRELIRECIFLQGIEEPRRRLARTPLRNYVRCHLQQTGPRVAHIAEVPGTQQAQVGFPRQVFDIDPRTDTLAEEAPQTRVPSLPP